MADRIVIEGGLVRHERIETISQAPAESLSQHLVRRIATTFPVMPSHPVRYMSIDGDNNRGLFLVEQAPGIRSIRVRHSSSAYRDDHQRREPDQDYGIWRVQFPWQYWAFAWRSNIRGDGAFADFVIDESLLLWSRDKWNSPNDRLWPAAVPNVSNHGGICWGNTGATNESLAARIDDYINTFSATTFNQDLGHFTPFGHSLTQWEANSPADDPTAWRNWAWWEAPGEHRPTTIAEIAVLEGRPQINMAELNPAFIELPEIPENFTHARTLEYLRRLSPAAVLRFREASIELTAEQVPEEVPA